MLENFQVFLIIEYGSVCSLVDSDDKGLLDTRIEKSKHYEVNLRSANQGKPNGTGSYVTLLKVIWLT